jgi:DNA-binding transcriptional LysR family regulator
VLDQITGMQIFVRTAAAGSFSAAARELGHSQTMVTKHIAALEQRLGVRLFQRTTRKLSLTEAGRIWLEACARILRELEEAEAAAGAGRLEARGLLRMNVPVSFGAHHVAPLLGAFAARHPQVSLELALNDRVVDLVEEGWDLTVRIGRLAESRLVARRLASCPLLVCAAPAYLAARGTPRTVAELGGHACLGYTMSGIVGADRWLFDRGRVAVPVSGPLRANNGDALCRAAIAGLGLIYQPAFLLAEALRDGRLVRVALDQPGVALGIHAVHAPDRSVPAKVRAMIEFLSERFRAAEWA